MRFLKISYLVIFVFLISCINKKEIFNKVKNYENVFQILSFKKDGFYGVKETIYYNNLRFKRYIYVYQKKIIIDGYFGRQNDSILFIPYLTIYQNCDIKPLVFCKLNNKESHYLGHSCIYKVFTVPTDILVKYDSIHSTQNNLYFSHNMLSDDDWTSSDESYNTFLETRYYKINLVTGLKIDSINSYNTTTEMYWWNY